MDKNKGIHGLIRKSDFPGVKPGKGQAVKEDDPSTLKQKDRM